MNSMTLFAVVRDVVIVMSGTGTSISGTAHRNTVNIDMKEDLWKRNYTPYGLQDDV